MSIATNVLIVVGVSFRVAAAGAAIVVASGTRSCTAASAVHTGEVVSTLGVVTTMDRVQSGLTGGAGLGVDDTENEEEEEEEEEEELASGRSVSSLTHET